MPVYGGSQLVAHLARATLLEYRFARIIKLPQVILLSSRTG